MWSVRWWWWCGTQTRGHALARWRSTKGTRGYEAHTSLQGRHRSAGRERAGHHITHVQHAGQALYSTVAVDTSHGSTRHGQCNGLLWVFVVGVVVSAAVFTVGAFSGAKNLSGKGWAGHTSGAQRGVACFSALQCTYTRTVGGAFSTPQNCTKRHAPAASRQRNAKPHATFAAFAAAGHPAPVPPVARSTRPSS